MIASIESKLFQEVRVFYLRGAERGVRSEGAMGVMARAKMDGVANEL